MTVNRVCGSGAQAIVTAAQEIRLGLGNAAVAGGMENMDRAPYLHRRRPLGLSDGPGADPRLHADATASTTPFPGEHSGWHTEDLVTQVPDHPRCPGPLGRALAAAVSRPRRRAGRFAPRW